MRLLNKQSREQESGSKPTLKTKIENIESYEVVFIGYPNWRGTIPRPVATFLSEYDFPGKTIVPFCTHEGSGLGRSERGIKKLCPNSGVLKGLAIRGRDEKNAQNEVSKWLHELEMIE